MTVSFSLQIFFTLPPSQICLEIIFALLSTTYLRIAFITNFSGDIALILPKINLHITSITNLSWAYLRIADYNLPSHCLHHKFIKRYGSVFSVYNLPSHHLHHKFVLSFSSHCLIHLTFALPSSQVYQEIWQRFLTTTYLHIASITSLS